MAKLPIDVKKIIHAEEIDNLDKVMTCINTIPSTSNTLKKLVVDKSFHTSYIKKWFNDKEDMIIEIFSVYVVPLLKKINHPSLLQEWKPNIDALAYEKILMITYITLLIKKKLIVMIASYTGQPQ